MNDGHRPSLTVDVHDERAGEVDDPDGAVVADLERWSEVATRTLEREGVAHGHLDILLVSEDAIAELNEQHMGHDGPTDVLSFPLDGPEVAADPTVGVDPQPHLGDIVLCPRVAGRQAPGHCGSFEAELTLLVVHGVLHVLGHDHADPDDALAMQARERDHLQTYGYRHPVLVQ